MSVTSPYDAIVVGGGFYGASIARYLVFHRGFRRVCVLEREREILMRASRLNQARIHNGYHYPRSYITAFRSRVNVPRFVKEFTAATRTDFTMIYAIARHQSKVSALQFERFCSDIGAALQPAPPEISRRFDASLIERSYLVQEDVFDASILAQQLAHDLNELGVVLLFGCDVTAVNRAADGVEVHALLDGTPSTFRANFVFNCTYSGLNDIAVADQRGVRTGLKHEIAEMALVELPDELQGMGITVMDGPFFSVMPFPVRNLHSVSHVRYTPHVSWSGGEQTPSVKLQAYNKFTHFDWMQRDIARYLPAFRHARYVESLFETKTVLISNERNDGRPILFEASTDVPGLFSVLGGKIDNVYDILHRLDETPLLPS